jgi:hypothetical protein
MNRLNDRLTDAVRDARLGGPDLEEIARRGRTRRVRRRVGAGLGAVVALAAVAVPLRALSQIGDGVGPGTVGAGVEVLEVSCTGGATIVLTPTVRLQEDGLLHVRVTQADADVVAVILGNTSDPEAITMGWSSGNAGIDGAFVKAIPPGEGRVLCAWEGDPVLGQGDEPNEPLLTREAMLAWPSFQITGSQASPMPCPENGMIPAGSTCRWSGSSWTVVSVGPEVPPCERAQPPEGAIEDSCRIVSTEVGGLGTSAMLEYDLTDGGTVRIWSVPGGRQIVFGDDGAAPEGASDASSEGSGDAERTGMYVFSDMEAGPSSAEPQDLAVTFTVAWSGNVYPGVHRCGYRALGADGSVIGEFVHLAIWHPGRWSHDVPGDPEAAVSGEAWCEPERLDTPGVADGVTAVLPDDVDPEPEEGTATAIAHEMERRLRDWASVYSVDSMSDDTLAANVVALWQAVSDTSDEHFTVTQQLMGRLHYVCVRLPEDHGFRSGEFCD